MSLLNSFVGFFHRNRRCVCEVLIFELRSVCGVAETVPEFHLTYELVCALYTSENTMCVLLFKILTRRSLLLYMPKCYFAENGLSTGKWCEKCIEMICESKNTIVNFQYRCPCTCSFLWRYHEFFLQSGYRFGGYILQMWWADRTVSAFGLEPWMHAIWYLYGMTSQPHAARSENVNRSKT